MSRRFRFVPCALLAAISAGVLAPAPASADMMRHWQSGEWSAAAFNSNQTKVFGDCRGSRSTDAAGSFSIAVTRGLNWVLLFAAPTPYQTPVSAPMQIGVRVDQGQRRAVMGRVVSPTMLEASLGMNADLIEAIRHGHVLSFDTPDGHHGNVALDGANALTGELTQCVEAQLAVEKTQPAAAAAPVQAQAGQPQTLPPAVAAQLELAATRIATNLLLQAKLPNAHLLAPAETPVALRGFGAAWSSDAGIGSVSVIPNIPGRDGQHVAMDIINGAANGCKGDFAAGRSTALVDDTLITKTYTACSDSVSTRALRFFILHRESSWYVVYTIVPPGAKPNGTVEQASVPEPLQDDNFQATAVKAALYQ